MAQSRSGAGGANEYVAPEKPNLPAYVERARVVTSEAGNVHAWGKPLAIELVIRANRSIESIGVAIQVVDSLDRAINHFFKTSLSFAEGSYSIECIIPKYRLFMGRYSLVLWLGDRRSNQVLDNVRYICPFEISMQNHARDLNYIEGECCYIEEYHWGTMKKLSED
jgi:hypothetical protein